jgi:mannose-6-phosphate isomerase-like protein (cupin superfamily)
MNKIVLSISPRTTACALSIVVAAATALAQQPKGNQQTKTYTSAADVAAMIAKAKGNRKEGQAIVPDTILSLAPYRAGLEYRASVGPASVHEKEAEIFYVIDGSATLTTGGKLTNEKRTNAANLTGSGIEGGTSRTVSKGDFVIVPENTPHWFSSINGVIVLMSLHVPRSGTGQ